MQRGYTDGAVTRRLEFIFFRRRINETLASQMRPMPISQFSQFSQFMYSPRMCPKLNYWRLAAVKRKWVIIQLFIKLYCYYYIIRIA